MLRRLRNKRDERGETFVELVVSTTLLGILGVGMITALSSTIIVSHADRGYAGAETVLRSYANKLEALPYTKCTTSPVNNAPYSAAQLTFTVPGFTTSHTPVQFLQAKNLSNITNVGTAFVSTCPAAGDQGVQRITLRAKQNNGSSSEQQVTILLRRGDA